MTGISRRAALLGLLGAAASGCARRPEPSEPSATHASAEPTFAPTPSATPPSPPRWPLTGRPLAGGDAAHAAVAVKVPDNRGEHPQAGLADADLVFVELDGYLDDAGLSSTRLVPVFHSWLPNAVGPVRSLRPVDVPLLAPLRAVVGNTGGAGWVVAYGAHHRAHLETSLDYQATKGTGAYSIDPTRVRVIRGVRYYDRAVLCHPSLLAPLAPAFASGPPRPYLPFAATSAEASTAGGAIARRVGVPWKGDAYVMGYDYDAASGRYLRSMPWGPHVLADGTRVATDNVLVVKAAQRRGRVFPGPGGAEPIHEIVNATGAFDYFHAGRAVSGTWTKIAAEEVFAFALSDGSPLLLAPGQTFVELPRADVRLQIEA